jgi:hypothetical protein
MPPFFYINRHAWENLPDKATLVHERMQKAAEDSRFRHRMDRWRNQSNIGRVSDTLHLFVRNALQ